MDDDEVVELAEKVWAGIKQNIKVDESLPEEAITKLYEVLKMNFKMGFFIGYNMCEEKYNPSLSFAKTTLRNLFNNGKVNL